MQNPGLQKFQEMMEGGLSRFSFFWLVFPGVLNLIPQTWQRQLDIWTIYVRNHIETNALSDIWNIFQVKTFFYMYSRIDSVGSFLFVERSSRHQETHAKKASNLVSCLSNFWGPGFCIHNKGILSHPKVDWPCQDFTQGSTREQPRAHTASSLAGCTHLKAPSYRLHLPRRFEALEQLE